MCVQLLNSVKVTELPPVFERAANSVYHLLFRCLLDMFVHLSLRCLGIALGSDPASSWCIFTSLIYKSISAYAIVR